jgi:hypothetical protein
MNKKLLSLIFALICIFAESVNTYTVLTSNKIGTIDGLSYELWKDRGDTYMTLLGGGKFTCSWSNINNALFRIGKKWDCTKTWQQLPKIKFLYEVEYRPNGNSYLCVYGWTREPLIEYYIVNSWGTWRPPGGNPIGQVKIDSATYDVYVTERVNQPSIDGTRTFKQYWSVNRAKKVKGTISVTRHFDEWTKMGLRLGKMYEASLTVEGYQSSGEANVKRNDIIEG